MDSQRLNELIKHSDLLGEDSIDELRSLLVRYPYFQTAWVLYLKNLYLLDHPSFKDELRRGALYVADLSVLFYYIEGKRFVIDNHFASGNDRLNDTDDRTLALIDRFLSGLSDKDMLSSELPLPVEPANDYTSFLLQDPGLDNTEEVLPMKGQDLIDGFIANSCSPSDDLSVHDEHPVASDTENGDEEYLTETLAKIYVKQQRYDKALEIIKKIYLKYPKKNVYFADQIRFLEKLIINAKSK